MSETDHSSDNVSMDSRDICYIPEENIELKLVFSEDEEMLIIRMFNLLGQRWRLIAGRIPGRTAEEIEKYWTSRSSSCEERVGRDRCLISVQEKNESFNEGYLF